MLAAMRDNARAHGFTEVVAPVRPERQAPRTAHADRRSTRTGCAPTDCPQDPWLRVHARAGATSIAMAPASMSVSASLEEWRAWTGLPFDTDGEVEVPGALVPVQCEPGTRVRGLRRAQRLDAAHPVTGGA